MNVLNQLPRGTFRKCWRLVLAAQVLVVLVGCSSTPLRYHQLASYKRTEEPIESEAAAGSVKPLVFSRIDLAEYLDRREVVFRDDEVTFSVDDNHLWGEALGGRLRQELRRCGALTETRASSGRGAGVSYRGRIERFDLDLKNSVALLEFAYWRPGQEHLVSRFEVSEPIIRSLSLVAGEDDAHEGKSISSGILALSEAVTKLCDFIVAGRSE